MSSGAMGGVPSYYDENIVDDHDAYFAKYYPNNNFEKHNIVEGGMMSGEPHAGTYFNKDIVDDHDAYFAKYYPNGNFDKHGIVPDNGIQAGTYYDPNIVDNQ